MAIQYKDYYEILGISRGANDEEIRRAFRRLARLYHPDKTGNDGRAEDRFKEINEAYEVLGDAQKRKRYDEFSSCSQSTSADEAWKSFTGTDAFGSSKRSQADHFTFTSSGFSDFFDELFGRNADSFRREEPVHRAEQREPLGEETAGDDLESDLWVTLDEVVKGSVRPITLRRAVRCRTCYGMGQYNAHACEVCHGKGSVVETNAFKVKIPQGIREGTFLRVPGRGEQGIAGAPAGNLYLKIHYSVHPDFHFQNGHLQYDLELAPWEAVLGTTVVIPALQGRTTMRIPAGTQNGHKLRLKERGLPSADGLNGDLIVKVHVQVPAETETKERRIWEELARESAFNPRDN
jgi:curved DNA-binding protein